MWRRLGKRVSMARWSSTERKWYLSRVFPELCGLHVLMCMINRSLQRRSRNQDNTVSGLQTRKMTQHLKSSSQAASADVGTSAASSRCLASGVFKSATLMTCHPSSCAQARTASVGSAQSALGAAAAARDLKWRHNARQSEQSQAGSSLDNNSAGRMHKERYAGECVA